MTTETLISQIFFNPSKRVPSVTNRRTTSKGLLEDIDTTSDRIGRTVAEKDKRVADILTGIAALNFSNFEDNDIDAFGDTYEYLISNYTSKARKSGGLIFYPTNRVETVGADRHGRQVRDQ